MGATLSESLFSRLLQFAAAALAVIIFLIDTFTPLPDALAVLYVIVVLMAANSCDRRSLLIAGIGCIGLTMLAFSIQHGVQYESAAFARCIVSVFAIGFSTFLILKMQAVESLSRERAKLLDVTHDAVFVRGANDVITYWNRGAEELYGWGSADAIGKVSHELMQTAFPQPVEVIKAILFSTGRWEGEIVHTRRDGKQVTVASRWSVLRREQGRPDAILETNNDVTERRHAEVALRRSEAHLAEAQRLSLTGSFGWNTDSQEIVWSNETYRIFECDPATKPTLDFVLQRTHPADVAAVRDIIMYPLRKGADWNIEHRLLMPDGSVKFVKVVAHAAKEELGRTEFIGAIMDVTAARRAELALQQAQSNLAHVNRVTTLGEMTASISHEVSQPIAAIVANAGAGLRWLAAQPCNLDETRLALSRIRKDGERASDVIARIRSLVRKIPTSKACFGINEVILEVIALAHSEAQKNHVSVHTTLPSNLPRIFGDRIQLQQVILNLMVNAIEAMSGDSCETRELHVSSELTASDDILVAVRDSGPGIDPKHFDHLFDAFFTTKPNGIGMGLAICRSIIEAHDGRMWVISAAPRGAIFQFSLPCGEEKV